MRVECVNLAALIHSIHRRKVMQKNMNVLKLEA